MSAYLQRLLSRAAPGAEFAIATTSIPAAPLASPLALHDQRLGLPDFDAPVPSEIVEGTMADPVEPATSTNRPRSDPVPTRRPKSSESKQRPELRIVTEAGPKGTPMLPTAKASEAAPKAQQAEAAPMLRPGPLDIGAYELEAAPTPLRTDAPIVESREAQPSPQQPIPATPKATELTVEPAERLIVDLPPDFLAERAPVTQNEQPKAEVVRRPAKGLQRPDEPQSPREIAASPLDLEPAEQRLSSVPHSTPEPAAPRGPEAMRERSVTIGEIVIDVHEPPRAQLTEASGANQAPATAAAASVIGPLPVRYSAVSLFGMRRR